MLSCLQADWTALHLAADRGNTDTVRLLLQNGAQCSATIKASMLAALLPLDASKHGA
jgi:ankyrin repeat protein